MLKLILFIRKLFWRIGFDFHKVGGYDYLHSLIHNNYHKDFTFLQIGAHDGKFCDPIHTYINFYKLKGYCLEPVDIYFDQLKINYSHNHRIVPIKSAIYEKSGKIKFYKHVDDISADISTIGMSSVLSDHHIRNGVDGSKIEEIEVDALSFADFFNLYPMENIDLLQIDAEGYDYNLIKMFPFDRFKPKIIHFEHGMPNDFMTREQLSELIYLLLGMNYKIITKYFDVLAYLD